MTAVLAMPRMGETMETGRIAAWLKQPGDSFKRGEVILEIETDKTTVEVPALDDGRLSEILAPEGAEIAVGEPIGRYDVVGGEQPGQAPTQALAPAAAQAPPPLSPPKPERSAAAGALAADLGNRRRATPVARRLALRNGMPLSSVSGSGRRGRIEKRDVEAAIDPTAPGLPPSMPELRFIALPRGRMAYRAWDPSGQPRRTLLFLHGFGADNATWASVASGLARDGIRVVVPDLPGHGATEIEASGFDAALEIIPFFSEALQLQAADLVGHSMGGAMAARLAAAGRLAPRSLTLLAPAGLGGEIDADFIQGMAAAATGGALAHLLRRLARKPPNASRQQLDRMAREFGRGRLQALATDLAQSGRQGIDIVSDLGNLAIPVRIIWGLDDRILPWTHVAAAPSRIAIHLMANAGHMPHWDQPQEMARLLA